MGRIHWWPMDSPHQGPTKRLMCNSRSTFASSILCNIKQNFHHSDVTCVSWASPSLATLFVHQPVHKNTKENNKAPHYWFLVRRNQQRPMESPHKGPAMWKAFIMQFQHFRSTYDGNTTFTQQWIHMHVLGFHLTGNCIVYSTKHIEKMQDNIKMTHYWSFLRIIHWWPIDSPHKGPAMRKASIMQFQDYISIFVSSILWKNYILAATVILNEHQRISYQWQLYCLLNSQYRKHRRKHQSSALLLPCGEKPSVTYGISTQRVSNAKNRSCNFSVTSTFVSSSISQR